MRTFWLVPWACGAALALPAQAQAEDRQTVRWTPTTDLPGAPMGSIVDMEFFNPAEPHAKPHTVNVIVFRAPEGTEYDFDALPQCKASNAELIARGPAACPEASAFQTGRVVMDTGSPAVFPRAVPIRTFTFIGDHELISVGEGEQFPFRGVVRSPVRGATVTVDYSEMPGAPPPDAYSAMKTMLTGGPARTNGDRTFVRSPPTCPPSGFWTSHYTIVYHDGVTQTETAEAPCRVGSLRQQSRHERRARRPVMTVTRQRASARRLNRTRSMRITVRADGVLRNARVRLVSARTGRTVASARARQLPPGATLTLRARRRASPGRHRLVIVATARDGRRLRASRLLRLRQ
jgi:hypothetical protein